MNTIKTQLEVILTSILLALAFTVNAQLSITVPLGSNVASKNIEVLSVDFMTEEVTQWGSLNNQNEIEIELSFDYMTNMLAEAKKQQAEAPKGWTLNFKTVNSEFVCSKYATGGVETTNGDAKIMMLPRFFAGLQAEQKRFGDMYAASNQDIAAWLHNYQMGSAPLGYYVEWMYVESEAQASGSCSMNTAGGGENEEFDAVTTYNLEFQEGWNMVVYETAEVFESSTGTNAVKHLKIYTTKWLPEGLQWFILE
jgi:hypothetical protein